MSLTMTLVAWHPVRTLTTAALAVLLNSAVAAYARRRRAYKRRGLKQQQILRNADIVHASTSQQSVPAAPSNSAQGAQPSVSTISSCGAVHHHQHTSDAAHPVPQDHPYLNTIGQLIAAVSPNNNNNSTTSSTSCLEPLVGHAAGWSLPLPPLPPISAPLKSDYQLVTTPRQLRKLGRRLMQIEEFAVDTEHHAHHSYLGVTCLIQVSTGTETYLVDTLKLWADIGRCLGPAFSCPSITKVLHGAGNDVLWLQRDFGLYLVNVFDTERAATALGYPRVNLGHLLQTICHVITDKSYQLADWTLRPLTLDMQLYACNDVHYLRFIAAYLRQQLCSSPAKDNNPQLPGSFPPLYAATLYKSQQLTLQLYRMHSHVEEVHSTAAQLTRRVLNSLGMQVGAVPNVSLLSVVQRAHAVSTAAHAPQAVVGSTETAGADAGSTAPRDVNHDAHQASGLSTATPSPPPPVPSPPPSADTARTADATVAGQQLGGPAGLIPAAVAAQAEALCCWRDMTARTHDESPQSIMHDSILAALILAQPLTSLQTLDVLQLHGWPDVEDYDPPPDTHLHQEQQKQRLWPTGLVRRLLRRPTSKDPIWKTICTLHQLLKGAAEVAAPGAALPSPLSRPAGTLDFTAGGEEGGAGAAGAAGLTVLSLPRPMDPEVRERVIKKFAAKAEVYSNCVMLASSGQKLCHCDRRKLEWYIQKGLAERVSDDPPTIRLLFEHKNTDQQAGEEFYTQAKVNRCVVCGDESHYLRYRVVPNCYRRFFPVALKSHRSHDVVLLCVPCHQSAHVAAQMTKQVVSELYGVPLNKPLGGLQTMSSSSSAQQAQGAQQHGGGDTAAAGDGAGVEQQGGCEVEGVGQHQACAEGQPVTSGDENSAGALDDGDEGDGSVRMSDQDDDDDDNENRHDNEQEEEDDEDDVDDEARDVDDASTRDPRGARVQKHPGQGSEKEDGGDGSASGGVVGSQSEAAISRATSASVSGGRGAGRGKGGVQQWPANASTARRAALALHRAGDKLPLDRRLLLENVIKRALGRDPAKEPPGLQTGELEIAMLMGLNKRKAARVLQGLPAEVAQQVSSMQDLSAEIKEGGGHAWHGEQVVKVAFERGGEDELQSIITRFRQSFVSYCKPRFLPQSWCVHHRHKRQFGAHSVFADNRLPPEPPALARSQSTTSDVNSIASA